MPKLRPAKSEEVVKVLHKLGFSFVPQSGSHAVYRHPDGRWTTVPIHKGRDVGRGLLRKSLKDAGISGEQFEELR